MFSSARLEPRDRRLRRPDSLRDLGLRESCSGASAKHLVEKRELLIELIVGAANTDAPKGATTEPSKIRLH
jgi:hypothetical protein